MQNSVYPHKYSNDWENFNETLSCLFKELYFFLPELFEIFRNMCHKIYELDLAKLLSVLGLAWQAA